MVNYNFDKDLKDGEDGEKVIRYFVEQHFGWKFRKFNDNSAYDILFQNKNKPPKTFEVKTDLWEKDWTKGGSGNLAIEFRCRGKDSGIRTTKSMFFCYYFPNLSIPQIWMIKTADLKQLIKDNKFRRKQVGERQYDNDRKSSWCYMIFRKDFREHFDVFEYDDETGLWHKTVEDWETWTKKTKKDIDDRNKKDEKQ